MTRSLWKADSHPPSFSALTEDIETDIAIVGGGITGITTAYLLAETGKQVVVLESREIASGTTGDSTGNLYTMLDNRLHHIKAKFDEETARKVAESRTAAVDLIEELQAKHQIDCNYKREPWHLYSETSKKDETIEDSKKTLQQFGLEVHDLEQLPLPFPVSSAIRVEDQAQFNPVAFVRGLSEKIDRKRCQIFTNTPVHHIEKGKPHVLETPKAKIKANQVILATHTPKGVYGLQTELFPHREYAIAVKLNSGEYPEGIFWDTETRNHQSVRSYENEEGKFLVIVGQHHKVGQAEENMDYFAALEKDARKNFDIASVDYKWSAQHYKPADGIPYIGESSDDHVFVATGFSTDGLTYGVVSAMIFRDLLTGKENSWAKIYSPKRFTPLKSAKSFLRGNLNVAKQYLKDYPGNVEARDFSEIKSGEGKIVEVKNEKWAVCRDAEGNLHASSAVCTHMECIVNWNTLEKSWDCPCHGSRFQPTGEVIEGPAYSPLDKRNINPEKK